MYLPRNELSYHFLTTIYIQVLQSEQLELSLSRWESHGSYQSRKYYHSYNIFYQ
jgi:hypothetical protein